MPYRVKGSVVEAESGLPLEGLVVRAYDEDAFVDDYLGESRTDAAGRFEVIFTEVQFMDLHETRPDLFVRIFDRTGTRLLLSLEDRVHRNAVADVVFDVRVPGAALVGS